MNKLQQTSLLKVIREDLGRLRGLLTLSVMLLITALAIVHLSHQNRELMVKREALLQQRDELDVEWRHLVIEQTALAEHNRIEQLAQINLQMQRPAGNQEVLVPWR